MDLLKAPVGSIFRKYLAASLGSAVVMSIYAFVDAIAIGQAEGPSGSAAMAVINPVFGIFIFLALVFGIGGSVLMSAARGKGDAEAGDTWFSAAMLLMGGATVIIWIVFLVFHDPILMCFGASEEMLPLVMRYGWWIIGFAPLIIAAVFLACFIRNDGNPGLAMKAVLIGGAFNLLGDWLLVFPMGLGITGAGIATIVSNGIQTVVLCTHFFSSKCTVRFLRPDALLKRAKEICSVGFGAGMLDLANVFLFCLFNNQIMKYGGVAYLAVFGAVETMSSLFQSLFAGVGQALQPVVSTNFGAQETVRVRKTLSYALLTGGGMGVMFMLLGVIAPQFVVRLFMTVTPEVLAIADGIIRPYSFTFLFMGVNVVATYQLQSTLRARQATVVSLLRGIVVSGVLIMVLPLLFGVHGIWYAMPVAECLVCILSSVWILQPNNYSSVSSNNN